MSNTEQNQPIRTAVYVCHCGLNIAGVVDCESVADYAAGLPNVALARHEGYLCSEPGQNRIRADIKESGVNRVVVASCSPRLHEPTFKQVLKDAGLNPYLLEMANLREQCSWVHMDDPEGATEKARNLVSAAVARAGRLEELDESEIPMERSTLVIGAGVAGIQAALDLADSGFQVTLVEKEASIGGMMARLDKTFPTMDCSI